MAGQGTEDTAKQFFNNTSLVRHKTRATYDTLIRQSRKMGRAATLAVGDASQTARQVLHKRPGRAHTHVDDINDLKKVVAHSHEVIVSAKTVLPFFFPHEIILDRSKITIIKRIFFYLTIIIVATFHKD